MHGTWQKEPHSRSRMQAESIVMVRRILRPLGIEPVSVSIHASRFESLAAKCLTPVVSPLVVFLSQLELLYIFHLIQHIDQTYCLFSSISLDPRQEGCNRRIPVHFNLPATNIMKCPIYIYFHMMSFQKIRELSRKII